MPTQIEKELDILRTALQEAKVKIETQNVMLQELTTLPLMHATVVSINVGWAKLKEIFGKNVATASIIAEGKVYEVLLPKTLGIAPGDVVRINTKTMAIIDIAPNRVGGVIGYIRKVIDDVFSEVDYQSDVKIVFNGMFNKKTLEKGDRIVLDKDGIVITQNLGKEDERFSFTQDTHVSWNDIGGLEEAKREMIEIIELPYKSPEIFKFYGKRPVKGVLLFGRHGNGKTLLGKAAATALSKIHSDKPSLSGFLYVKGPEILNKYVGEQETTIRQIFQTTRKHKEKHGFPAIVFIDEADAILRRRGSGISSDVEHTIVPMFLTEMDGLEESGALVILATNRPDILDPAVIRDGRIDRKIKIDAPSSVGAEQIFFMNLKNIPLNNGYTKRELASYSADALFSKERLLYRVYTKDSKTFDFTLSNIVNGAMIVSIVDQATTIAIRRDLASTKGKGAGICKEDLLLAIASVEEQNRSLNHEDELAEFVYEYRHNVIDIHRISKIR